MKAKVRSFLITYRWELWLIVGIPAILSILLVPLTSFAPLILPISDAATYSTYFHLLFMVVSGVGLLLLAVSYLRVRNLGRDFLAVLWGYVIAASVMSTTTQGVFLLVGVVFPTENDLSNLGRTFSFAGFALLLEIFVLLWFARMASRLSLTHAVFLLVYSSLNVVGSVTGSPIAVHSTYLYLIHYLAGAAIGLTVVLAKVWLLGNFERRSPRFRRDAAIGLLATLILSGYARVLIADLLGFAEGPYLTLIPFLGLFLGLAAFIATTAFELAFLGMFFALVYLVRVRRPAADAELELEAPTVTPGEER